MDEIKDLVNKAKQKSKEFSEKASAETHKVLD